MPNPPPPPGGPLPPQTNPDEPVTPKTIWDTLEHHGASSIQAAALLGNGIAESGLNPEARVKDSNGYFSNGIWQFNEHSYPGSGSLVTGHPAKDMTAQVKFLIATGGLRAARGSNPAEAASNFAANYERCSTCQQGGASNEQRQANATQAAGWASSGNWPVSTGQASDTATLTSSQAAQERASCAFYLGGGQINLLIYHQSLPGFCIISKPQLRAVLASGILVIGGGVALLGVLVLTASALGSTGVGQAAGRVAGNGLEAVGVGASVLGAPEVGAGVAAAGSGVKRVSGGRPGAGARYSRERRERNRADKREVAELRAKGASDIRTARKPPGTLGKPTHPGRKVGSISPRDTPPNDKPPF